MKVNCWPDVGQVSMKYSPCPFGEGNLCGEFRVRNLKVQYLIALTGCV
jgi:hypothetical protein